MRSHSSVTGIVLAGGLSRRLGRDKAVELVAGQMLIQRVLSRISQVTEEIVVVVNDTSRASTLPIGNDAHLAIDMYPDSGSLGAIFTGLMASHSDWGIVVACDMPFLNIPLLQKILSLRDNHDAVVPLLNGRPEPIHSAYSKTCLPHIENKLQENNLKIATFFNDIDVEYLQQEEVEMLDKNHYSFFNVNTEQDLETARQIAIKGM